MVTLFVHLIKKDPIDVKQMCSTIKKILTNYIEMQNESLTLMLQLVVGYFTLPPDDALFILLLWNRLEL